MDRDLLEKVSKGEVSVEEAKKQSAEREVRDDSIFLVKEPEAGKVVYSKPAPESGFWVGVIVVLLILELMYDALFMMSILYSWESWYQAFTLGMASLILSFILLFYIYGFLPDTLILKHRMHKVVPSKEINWWSFK